MNTKKLFILMWVALALPLCGLWGESITLTWTDNSDNELGFEVERSLDGSDFELIGTVPENVTAYTDSGLAAGNVVVYRVRAYNHSNYSGYSNEASTTVEDGKYFQPFEEGESPGPLNGQQVVASLTIHAESVTVVQNKPRSE